MGLGNIFFLFVDDKNIDVSKFISQLSKNQRERYVNFNSSQRRQEYLFSRVMMNQLFQNVSHSNEKHLTLSHSDTLIGLSHHANYPIGIDIELLTRSVLFLKKSRHISLETHRFCSHLDTFIENRRYLFLSLLKESWIKFVRGRVSDASHLNISLDKESGCIHIDTTHSVVIYCLKVYRFLVILISEHHFIPDISEAFLSKYQNDAFDFNQQDYPFFKIYPEILFSLASLDEFLNPE